MTRIATYLLPGLGFDAGIFAQLRPHLPGSEVLEWIEPEQGESLPRYAGRLARGIPADERVVLIGHSFGGIVAQEIAAQRDVAAVVLIASIRDRTENPWSFKVLAPLKLHWLFNKAGTLATFRFWAKRHGYSTEEKRALFRRMVAAQSDHNLRWSLGRLSRWPGAPAHPAPVFQIHGDRDRIFPIRRLRRPDRVIEGGDHLVLYDRPHEVARCIRDLLGSVESGER